jgi:hypothetical protein
MTGCDCGHEHVIAPEEPVTKIGPLTVKGKFISPFSGLFELIALLIIGVIGSLTAVAGIVRLSDRDPSGLMLIAYAVALIALTEWGRRFVIRHSVDF